MGIRVGKEVEKVVYDFPVDLDEESRQSLLRYAQDEITMEEMDTLLLEWVMVKIIREKTEEFLNNLPEEDK